MKPYAQGGHPLPYQLKTAAAWPTPDASEAGKTSRSGERKDEPLIGGIVRTSWPTPRQADFDKGVRSPAGYEKEKIRMGDGCDLPTELNHLGKTPVWVPCADGKLRRAPDDSFELVDGLHRSLLAALGNSIVPEEAFQILSVARIVLADSE